MSKFKTQLSPDAVFSFKGQNYQTRDYVFETDDKELIEFLGSNANFAPVTDAKAPEADKAKKAPEADKANDD